MYKLLLNTFNTPSGVFLESANLCVPFSESNTDYQVFKTYLMTEGSQLQDAEGAAMTAEQIATFLETLP